MEKVLAIPTLPALDYFFLSGSASWFRHKMLFSVNGFDQYVARSVKTNLRHHMLEFQLHDRAGTLVQYGFLADGSRTIYKIVNASDQSDHFSIELFTGKAYVGIGGNTAKINLSQKQTETQLMGESLIINRPRSGIEASVSLNLLDKLPLEKIIAMLFVIWTAKR